MMIRTWEIWLALGVWWALELVAPFVGYRTHNDMISITFFAGSLAFLAWLNRKTGRL